MEKLKLAVPFDDKPVKLTVELPPQVHRDLVAYAEALGCDTSQPTEPAKLVAPMLAKFMTNDRAFQKALRSSRRRLDAALMNTATETQGNVNNGLV